MTFTQNSINNTLPNGTVATTQSAGDSTTKVATDAFVTTAIANAIAGVNPAIAVQAATTTAGNTSGYTYNNGAGGIGATLTGTNNTALTVDGFTFTAIGQRLLVKNDTQSPSGAFNGVYSVTQVQATLLPLILIRATDYDQPSDINNTGAIPVANGTANASTSWLLTSTVNTVGTDPLTYTQFSINPTTILSNSLSSANIFVGNVSNIATGVAVTGNVTISNTGVTTIGSGQVTNSMLASPPSAGFYVSTGVIEEHLYANGNSGTSLAVNLDNGNLQSVTITGAVAITQTTPTHPGKYTLIVTQDGIGHVYSLSGVKTANGAGLTYSTAASKIDIISIIYDGTNFYAQSAVAFA